MRASLLTHLDSLFSWLAHNGLAGWDPYDIWDTRLGAWATGGTGAIRRVARVAIARAGVVAPLALRHALGAAPAINPKAVGLIAAAILNREESGVDPDTGFGGLSADECFRWLDANRVPCAGGSGWGYPFDWRSRIPIPRGTPTAVNSAIIGHAYWLRYLRTGEAEALARCEEVCRFLGQGLRRTGAADGTFCFSYTPIDTFQVHNANLFAAEFLVRVGTHTGNSRWVDDGIRAGRFSLREILEDGTLPYWSKAQSADVHQDTYHSGFEIRGLHGIGQATGLSEFTAAAMAYYANWRSAFFEPNGAPGHTRGSRGIIEVHSLAEALICPSTLYLAGGLDRANLLQVVGPALAAGVSALWVQADDGVGYFAHTARRRHGVTLRTNIPYVRWGQAWMAFAMSLALNALSASGPRHEEQPVT